MRKNLLNELKWEKFLKPVLAYIYAWQETRRRNVSSGVLYPSHTKRDVSNDLASPGDMLRW